MSFKRFFTEQQDIKDWHGYVSRNPELKAGVEVLHKLEAIGGDAYIVGGTVRDILLGEEPKDVDIATNIPLEKIENAFQTYDIGKNKDFGIVVAKHGGFDFEIANFRKDGTYSDGRHPDSVEIVMSFQDDAARRDLTINAMAVDKDGAIVDYFNGAEDIKAKVVKTVGVPANRFSEDFLRMLRVPRFASRLGFKIDDETVEAIKNQSGSIKEVAVERIMQEVLKMAKQSGDKFANAIIMMKDLGLLEHIFPEIFEMDQFEHNVEHHPEGNVFDHTIAALRSNKVDDPILNLAILFHDIGKPATYKNREGKGHTYYGHAESAKDIIFDLAKRLKLENNTRDQIIFAALYHMNFHDLTKMKANKVMKIIDSPFWDILVDVSKADSLARGEEMFDQQGWDEIIARSEELIRRYGDDKVKKLVGKLIPQLRPDVKPGPRYGDIIKNAVTRILKNNIDLDDMAAVEKVIKSS
jgi:tRNA nucleotidyltransferase (CCA-adding enzyme)